MPQNFDEKTIKELQRITEEFNTKVIDVIADKWKEYNCSVIKGGIPAYVDNGGKYSGYIHCDCCGNKWKGNLYYPKYCEKCGGYKQIQLPFMDIEEKNKMSKSEIKIKDELIKNGYSIVSESKEQDMDKTVINEHHMNDNTQLRGDFFITDKKYLIEVQGSQHFIDSCYEDKQNEPKQREIIAMQFIRDVAKFKLYNERCVYYVGEDVPDRTQSGFFNNTVDIITNFIMDMAINSTNEFAIIIKKAIEKKYIPTLERHSIAYANYIIESIRKMYSLNAFLTPEQCIQKALNS